MGIVIKISGTGSYLPERVVTNAEIAPRMNSSDEWIFTHTGIRSRHVASPQESASSLAVNAARRAMEAAGAKPEEIGLVICATTTPDYGNHPSTACIIQNELGLPDCMAYDLAAACSGFVYGLETARGFLMCHPGRKALVIGSEVLTRAVDYSDRSVAMIFGDGAGAAVLEAETCADEPKYVSVMGADGSGAHSIERDLGCRKPVVEDFIGETPATMPVPWVKMDGHSVFTFAVRKLEEIVRKLCADAGVEISALDWIVPHQANARILDSVSRRLSVPLDKFFMNLPTVANTSGASIAICLDEMVRTGKMTDGTRFVMAGFGSGLTWAGILMTWPYLKV